MIIIVHFYDFKPMVFLDLFILFMQNFVQYLDPFSPFLLFIIYTQFFNQSIILLINQMPYVPFGLLLFSDDINLFVLNSMHINKPIVILIIRNKVSLNEGKLEAGNFIQIVIYFVEYVEAILVRITLFQIMFKQLFFI